jgi:hypothetical protein
MNKNISREVKAAQKLLKNEGFFFRLASVSEKREDARLYKKKHFLPCSYGRPERKALRDVYDHFKKDVWIVMYGARLIGMWSSRVLIREAKGYGQYRSAAICPKRYPREKITIEPPLEDTDAAGWHPDDHFCKNCPEHVDWEDYKNQKHDVALDNSPFSAILH